MVGNKLRGFTLALCCLTVAAQSYGQESRDYESCVGLEDAAARLACYDEIVNQQVPAEADESAPATEPVEQVVPSAAGEPMPLSEEIGREQLSGDDEEPERFAGKVTDCRQDAANKWYFFFDNGQVWKQKNSGRQRFKDCDFEATITKDVFGYKMQVDGEGKKIRIGRIR
jgi:hypothetical protein